MKRALIILAAVALAMVAVQAGAATPIVGTHGDDTLRGGDGTQVIHGLAGNDKLHGGEDFDLLYGGPGNDKLFSGNDDEFDRLYGGTGNDVLNNWSPEDNSDWSSEYVTLDGGPGFDTCIGTPQVTVFISCEVIKTAP